jgi:hypothetical protein
MVPFLFLASACGSVSDDAIRARQFFGCYELSWSGIDSMVASTLVPDAIRLTDDSIAFGPAGVTHRRVRWAFDDRAAHPTQGTDVPWHERFYNRWWSAPAMDSVYVEMLDEGHLLWVIAMRSSGDSLSGTATLRSHARGLRTRSEVTARPMACDESGGRTSPPGASAGDPGE